MFLQLLRRVMMSLLPSHCEVTIKMMKMMMMMMMIVIYDRDKGILCVSGN